MPRKGESDCDETDNRIEPETLRIDYDWDDDLPLSTTVIKAVSSVTDSQTATLPPLYDVIDPDALDGLFQPASADSPRDIGEVSFTFEGVSVTIRASGDIVLTVPARDLSE